MGAVVNQIPSSFASPLFVGIDVSGPFLDIAYHGSVETFRLPNAPEGFAELINRLLPLKPELIVLEATGKLERAVLQDPPDNWPRPIASMRASSLATVPS
jgi:transposase